MHTRWSLRPFVAPARCRPRALCSSVMHVPAAACTRWATTPGSLAVIEGTRAHQCDPGHLPQNESAQKFSESTNCKRTHRGGLGTLLTSCYGCACGLRVRATAGIKNGTWRVRRETADSTPPSRTRSARRPSPAPRNQGVIRQRCNLPHQLKWLGGWWGLGGRANALEQCVAARGIWVRPREAGVFRLRWEASEHSARRTPRE